MAFHSHVVRFCGDVSGMAEVGDYGEIYMIIYISENFLWRNYELRHFPHCLWAGSASI